jgi:FkbM family methyltransferase
MAHTFNGGAPRLTPARPRWRRMLPAPVRSMGRPLVHAWQRFQYNRAERQAREREERLDSEERKFVLDRATPIIEDVHGIRFVLYPHDRPNMLCLVKRAADVADFRVIPLFVKPGDIAFDIGAHVGTYSVLLSRLCTATGRVWAFEPAPDTYWRLRETLALNRCSNVVALESAVSDIDGTARINLFDPQFSEWNSLASPCFTAPDGTRVSPHESLDVPALTLDEFCAAEKIARVNFLKVDVEGFEVSVFRGAERLLRRRCVDYICFEISQTPLRAAGLEPREVFGALGERGYSSFRLNRATGTFEGPILDTSEDWANYYASPMDLTVQNGSVQNHDL